MSIPAKAPINVMSASADPTVPTLAAGDIYYFSTDKTIRIYDGSAWVGLANLSVSQTFSASKTFTGGAVFNSAITGNNTINLTGTSASSVAGTWTATALIPSGLTGATSSSRYVGATTGGAPGSGTFSTGDFIIDRTGGIYICTSGGTPGTWTAVSGSLSYATTSEIANVDHASESAGASSTVARGDHKHDVNSATAVVLSGTSAGAGSSTSLALADHQHSIVFPAGASGTPSLRMPHGSAPSSPTNGDVWTTTAGLFLRQNGTTVSFVDTVNTQSGIAGDKTFTGTLTSSNGTNSSSVTNGGFSTFLSTGMQFATTLLSSEAKLGLYSDDATVGSTTKNALIELGTSYYSGSALFNTLSLRAVQTSATATGYELRVKMGSNDRYTFAESGAFSAVSTVQGTALIPTGLTGATQASRYVGATSSGSPGSGTFSTGDFVVAQNGKIYVCTSGGSPGTWTDIGGGGSSPLTTKGDLFTYDTGNQRLAVGTAGYHLTPDSSAGTGLKWMDFEIPVTFSYDGELTISTGLEHWYARGSYIITAVRGHVSTPGGSLCRVDVNVNGTSIHSTQSKRLNLNSANSGVDLVTGADIDVNTLADGDYLSIDIDAGGGAEGLTVIIWLRRVG
jgi:hypothetical protein